MDDLPDDFQSRLAYRIAYVKVARLAAGVCRRLNAAALSFPESDRFVRAAGCIAGAVGMRTRPGQLPTIDDQVFFADGTAREPALQDLAGPGGVTRLRRQARA